MAKDPISEAEEAEQYAFIRAVGQRIQAAREKSGMSRRQMTERANLKHAYGFLIEDGGQNFTLKTLYTLCKVLDCTPIDLMPNAPSMTDSEAELQLLRQRVLRHLEQMDQLEASTHELRATVRATKRFGQT